MPHDIKESKTLNAIQVRIDDNVRMLAELHARWEREDEIAINSKMTKVCTITTSNIETPRADTPTTSDGKIQGAGKVPIKYRKVQKPTPDKCVEIF